MMKMLFICQYYRNKSFQSPLLFAFESYDMVKSIFLQVFPADTNSSLFTVV